MWTYDLTRGIPTRLTFDEGIDSYPLWTPDSQRIVFYSSRDGGGLFWQAADGTGQVERLTTTTGTQIHIPTTFLSDGSQLIYFTQTGVASELYALSIDGEHTSELLVESEFDQDGADVSPNGRWIAYATDESGQDEVYVRPYPDIDDGKWQVSTDGGAEPLWGPNGQELFYRDGGTVMVLSVSDESGFSPGLPEELFTWRRMGGRGHSYHISPDGQRFLANREGDARETTSHVVIVENWFEELNRLAPPSE